MVDLVLVDDYSLDEASLELASELYVDFRRKSDDVEDGWNEQYKWDILSELNQWHRHNELTAETVPEFVDKLSELSPQEGPLVNWRDLEDLEAFAEDDSAHLADLLASLYEGEADIENRIAQFRGALNIGTPAIGFLLSAYDLDRFPPYKDGTFNRFIEYFSGHLRPNPHALSVHQKYGLYLDYCENLREILESTGVVDSPSVLDAQDFMYTLVEYDAPRYNFIIRFLLRFADTLEEFRNVPLSILEELETMPNEYIRDRMSYYEGREKVARVRYHVLDAILADEDINLHELKQDEDARHEENIFQAWTDYKILAQPYLDFFKQRFVRYLDDLGAFLVEEFGADELDYHWVSFQGASSFPGTRSWMALHPSNRNFRDAHQLFLDFQPQHLEIGLHSGSNLGDERMEHIRIEDDDEATISLIIEEFRSHKSDFDRLNGGIPPFPDDEVEELDRLPSIARQLEQSKQMVFHGPPGTGKTFYAINFAKWWVDGEDGDVDEQVQMVTFHPSYTYEDYIEGLTAQVKGDNLVYDVAPGVFKEFSERARENWEANGDEAGRYVLIVDEINRGNLSKIFGETITLLERDKRLGGSSTVPINLAHSGDSFGVPPNLYLIGTMNTADRSIALVDAALRRRFRFEEFPPNYELLYEEYDLESETVARDLASQDDLKGLQALSVLALQKINQRIIDSESLNKGKQIGHSYLLPSGPGAMGEQNLVEAWKHEILPLLDEYFFGQFTRLSERMLREASDDLLNEDTHQIANFGVKELRTGLRSLVSSEAD